MLFLEMGSLGILAPRLGLAFLWPGRGGEGGEGGWKEKESPSGMRNYKASRSESPCVGMNRKICLSLFPHPPPSLSRPDIR